VAGRKEHVAGSSSLAFANLVKNCLTMAAVSSNVASSRSSVSPSDLRMANPAGFGEAVRYNSFLSFRAQSPDQVRADAARLERVIARDSEALAELYDEHGRRLFGLILRILKDRDEAEEVLQEVFVQAWTRASTYDHGLGSPAGWLLGIARNRAIDRLRANSVRVRAVEAVPEPPPTESPEGRAAVAERQRDVQQALDALPAEQRELIEQAYFLGFTHSELAARLSLPLGTVKTRIRRGLLSLRSQFETRLMEQ
jgi:RNA polymerase sigma-70 factor (ECF subfamily)